MNLSKSKIFLIFSLAFILGVFLGRYANFEIMAFAAMIFVMLASLGWSNKAIRVLGLAGLIVVLGSLRWSQALDSDTFGQMYDREVQIEGIISDEPDERADKTYLTLNNLQVDNNPVETKILIAVQRYPEYEYGDLLQFRSKIKEPKDAEKSGEFSYRNYLSRFGIEGVVYYPEIELIAAGQGNPVKSQILKLKKKFTDNLSQVLSEPHNSFLAGLLVGERGGISENLKEKFKRTGTTHIIAISGYNITIIAWALDKLLERFGRRISFAASLICIALFVVLTGASASVVRAAIMGALGLLALNIGRLYAINNALALTAAVMVGINPKIIHFDIGFQLSFLALLGLVYFSPLIEKIFLILPGFVRIPFSATLAAQIFTLPILIYNFDRLSLVSPITNVLILFAVPYAMGVGFVTGAASFLLPVAAQFMSWFAWAVLEYIIKVVELTAAIPGSFLNITMPVYLIPVYYCLIVSGFLVYKWKLQQKTQSST